MAGILTPNTLENQLVSRVGALESALRAIRAKQLSGSDTLATTVGSVVTAGTYNLTTGWADVTGMSLSITPLVASTIIVAAVWDLNANGAAVVNDSVSGRLDIDGTPQTDLVYYIFRVGTSRATLGNIYVASLTAAAHTIKMQAINNTAARGRVDVNTAMTYWLFAS